LSYWRSDERKLIPMKIKRAVYDRAKGKCEKCGIQLSIKEGDFHHTRDPTVTPRATSIRFLCPTCHRKYGHRRVTREDNWGSKEVKIVRRKVVKTPRQKKKDLLKKLTVPKLKILSKKHDVKVKGKVERGLLRDYRKAPTKQQYVNALSRRVTIEEIESLLKDTTNSAR